MIILPKKENFITMIFMKNIKKQSPVEWLVEDLTRLGHNFKLYKKEIDQAKAMEKEQQIIEPKTSFISWVKNPNDEEDGLILIDEGVLIELPQKAKNDLIEYLKEFLKK